MKIEEQYIDVYKGIMYCDLKEGRKKLCSFVFSHDTDFQYKYESKNIDGQHPLRYRHFEREGFQFRPIVQGRCLEFLYLDIKNPEPIRKNVIYLLVKKDAWEKMCRLLFSRNENNISISGYANRKELPPISEVLLNIEDEDEKLLDEWEEEN